MALERLEKIGIVAGVALGTLGCLGGLASYVQSTEALRVARATARPFLDVLAARVSADSTDAAPKFEIDIKNSGTSAAQHVHFNGHYVFSGRPGVFGGGYIPPGFASSDFSYKEVTRIFPGNTATLYVAFMKPLNMKEWHAFAGAIAYLDETLGSGREDSVCFQSESPTAMSQCASPFMYRERSR